MFVFLLPLVNAETACTCFPTPHVSIVYWIALLLLLLHLRVENEERDEPSSVGYHHPTLPYPRDEAKKVLVEMLH